MRTPIKEYADKFAGNWKQFESFGWHGKPDNADRCGVYHIDNRDSGLLETSNAHVMRKALLKFPSIHEEEFSHWACGWTKVLVVTVFDKRGKLTKGFLAFHSFIEALSDYPVLDEEDYSRREYEAALDAIKSEGRNLIKGTLPDDWTSDVYSWLSNNEPDECENQDDRGAYPSKESIKRALIALQIPLED